MRPRLFLFITLFLSVSLAARAVEPFEIREGDRVLFLGDTLLEREGTYGYLETRMHEQFPDRHFIVRNLSWSGETPRGWSRASFDGPDKGYERLKEDIAKVRPTVVFLGFGMAASLQEMTDRSADITLNPDPKRYGEEPMSAARFKKELGELMDAIATGGTRSVASVAGAAPSADHGPDGAGPSSAPVRFVLLSPIRHEDLRAVKPGLPDPAEHNKLLEQYTAALAELAKERTTRFIDLFHAWEKAPRKNITPADATALAGAAEDLSPNGIHLSELGYSAFAEDTGSLLGWTRQLPSERAAFDAWKEKHKAFSRAVLPAVIKKNELFFHQFRPANSTYLFGFRKHEQGQNAKEMPMFDPLIEAAELEIDRLKLAGSPTKAKGSSAEAKESSAGARGSSAGAKESSAGAKESSAGARGSSAEPVANGAIPPPLPDFTVEDGYQIELWAQNPYLEKPTQMNWDPQGRLWVCSSSLYPQIEPGQVANDKILVLEDTNGDGKADKSTIFVDGLLIPTGVVPDLVAQEGETRRQGEGAKLPGSPSPTLPLSHSPPLSPSACYVGQSTELLYFRDTDGDGKADEKRIVFSGFGTEDTHHIVHTLHWGPDGRLYFHQSVYIHTHLETPWGMVRLNSGGVFAYDPRTERVEVFIKGLWNTWGQAEDDWGQSFFTDGAGSTGLSWGFPGAIFAPFEGSRRQMASISPGSYPKFAGLEIVKSPHFPAEWQGNAVTCDFRAHRIVRFRIEDLAAKDEGGRMKDEVNGDRAVGTNAGAPANPSTTPPPSSSSLILHPSSLAKSSLAKSGYTTIEQPDLVRTTDLSFRPIDVRLGPDGALYVADWSNPVINHGEVDFRDPRRDHHMGRIWRITKKDTPALKWEPLLGKKNEELLDKLLSKSAWERQQAKRVLAGNDRLDVTAALGRWVNAPMSEGRNDMWPYEERLLGALLLQSSIQLPPVFEAKMLAGNDTTAPNGGPAEKAGPYSATSRAFAARTIGIWYEWHKRDLALSAAEANGRSNEDRRDAKAYLQLWTERNPLGWLALDPNPRVRLEAMRALARIQTAESASLVLDAALKTPENDPHYDFAAWLSINDLAKPWTDAIASGAWKTEGHEAQLAYGLKSIDPTLASATLSRLFAAGKVPVDGSGPWIELIGDAGGPAELQRLLDGLLAGYVGDCCETDATRAIDTRLALTGPVAPRAVAALLTAARVRNTKPAAHTDLVTALFHSQGEIGTGSIALAGLWHAPDAVAKIGELLDSRETKPPLRRAAVDGLRAAGGPAALGFLRVLTRAEETTDTRSAALVAAVQVKLDAGLVLAAEVLPTFTDENVLLGTWRGLLAVKGAPDAFALKFGGTRSVVSPIQGPDGAGPSIFASLPAPVIAAAVRA
ncbi:MAG: hypothetical protein WCF18_25045, partial [Chthoniobacteraceae bacterium]